MSSSSTVVSEKRKNLHEEIVEHFAHCTLAHLALEMKLNVAGISLPAVVLMLTFVAQPHV